MFFFRGHSVGSQGRANADAGQKDLIVGAVPLTYLLLHPFVDEAALGAFGFDPLAQLRRQQGRLHGDLLRLGRQRVRAGDVGQAVQGAQLDDRGLFGALGLVGRIGVGFFLVDIDFHGEPP